MLSKSELISRVEGSATLAINALVKKLKAEGKDVLSFSAGETDFPTPANIKKAAIDAINANFTRYTPNQGIPELIDAIIKKFKDENNLVFNSKEILVSNGAKQSLYNLLLALVNPGEEVVYQSPYWVSYPEMVKMTQGISKIISAPVSQGYKITPEQLDESITENTKVFIFNSPSNPTGVVYTQDEIEMLGEVLKRKNCYIISDEIYEKIIFDGVKHFSLAQIPGLRERTIIVNGVSKAYSMTGWRIGYAAGDPKIIELAANLQSHSTSNACSISQKASLEAIAGPQNEISDMCNVFQKRRDNLCRLIGDIPGLKFPVPQGAFYVFFDASGYFGKSYQEYAIKNSQDLCKFLLAIGNIGLVPGDSFGDDNCLRLSFACSESQLEEGINRLKESLKLLN
ncbi:MAG: pyridoxal phosphate-dependent aminotransferase [Ignavibacteriaceae bacterium]|nr:pyridoxal phosphate-dependent aminotransferase [Ignavibacteriaceae bacterium]